MGSFGESSSYLPPDGFVGEKERTFPENLRSTNGERLYRTTSDHQRNYGGHGEATEGPGKSFEVLVAFHENLSWSRIRTTTRLPVTPTTKVSYIAGSLGTALNNFWVYGSLGAPKTALVAPCSMTLPCSSTTVSSHRVAITDRS